MTAAAADLRARQAFVTKRRAAISKQQAARAAQLRSARTYAGSFRGVMNRYGQSRSDLQSWIDTVRNGSDTSYAEAYQVLAQQVSRRQQLRTEFAALTAPAEIASAHGQILRVIDRAIDATETASLGVAEYQADFLDTYGYFENTPSWQRFQAESDSITREFDSAVGAWEASLAKLEQRLTKKSRLPPLPANESL